MTRYKQHITGLQDHTMSLDILKLQVILHAQRKLFRVLNYGRGVFSSLEYIYTTPLADPGGGGRQGRPPVHFHAVLGEIGQNNRWAAPPLRLAPPPLGNPGSTTAHEFRIEIIL